MDKRDKKEYMKEYRIKNKENIKYSNLSVEDIKPLQLTGGQKI